MLDSGSAYGAHFRRLEFRAVGCVGIDPTLDETVEGGRFKLIPGMFPQDLPVGELFDAITLLAVLEHFPEAAYPSLAEGCSRFLKPGGKVIITVPSPRVDQILKVLKALRLVDGMSLEEHHGYEVDQTAKIFCPPNFRLICRRSFQLGLNHLFVFHREPGRPGDSK